MVFSNTKATNPRGLTMTDTKAKIMSIQPETVIVWEYEDEYENSPICVTDIMDSSNVWTAIDQHRPRKINIVNEKGKEVGEFQLRFFIED